MTVLYVGFKNNNNKNANLLYSESYIANLLYISSTDLLEKNSWTRYKSRAFTKINKLKTCLPQIRTNSQWFTYIQLLYMWICLSMFVSLVEHYWYVIHTWVLNSMRSILFSCWIFCLAPYLDWTSMAYRLDGPQPRKQSAIIPQWHDVEEKHCLVITLLNQICDRVEFSSTTMLLIAL